MENTKKKRISVRDTKKGSETKLEEIILSRKIRFEQNTSKQIKRDRRGLNGDFTSLKQTSKPCG